MLKLQRIRAWIGLIAVLAFAAGVFSMQDRLAAWWTGGRSSLTVGQEERDWRRQELAFLKIIYDRLERQRQEAGGNAPASLRREQEAILQRITETAKPILDKVPADIAALLSDPAASTPEKPEPRDAPGAAAPPPAGSAVAPAPPMPAPAAPPPALPEVRIDPASIPRIEVDLSPLSRPPEPDRPAERIVKLREPRPAKPAEEKKPVEEKKPGEANAKASKPGEAKPAESKPAEPKPAEAKAGDTKSEAKPKAKAAKPKPAAAAPEASGTAKE